MRSLYRSHGVGFECVNFGYNLWQTLDQPRHNHSQSMLCWVVARLNSNMLQRRWNVQYLSCITWVLSVERRSLHHSRLYAGTGSVLKTKLYTQIVAIVLIPPTTWPSIVHIIEFKPIVPQRIQHPTNESANQPALQPTSPPTNPSANEQTTQPTRNHVCKYCTVNITMRTILENMVVIFLDKCSHFHVIVIVNVIVFVIVITDRRYCTLDKPISAQSFLAVGRV